MSPEQIYIEILYCEQRTTVTLFHLLSDVRHKMYLLKENIFLFSKLSAQPETRSFWIKEELWYNKSKTCTLLNFLNRAACFYRFRVNSPWNDFESSCLSFQKFSSKVLTCIVELSHQENMWKAMFDNKAGIWTRKVNTESAQRSSVQLCMKSSQN